MLSHVLLAVFCLAAAVLDVRYRRLPNLLNLLTLLCGLVLAFSLGGLPALGSHALHMVVALVLGGTLFYFQLLGGGDAKFYAAVASWFAIGRAWPLGLAILLCGGVMACCWIGMRMVSRRSMAIRKGESSRGDLPYGVAIAAGALIVLLWDSF